MKYLPLYERHGECNQDYPYLCIYFDDDKLFKLIRPTKKEILLFAIESNCDQDYIDRVSGIESPDWGSYVDGIRPTVVLLLAAMNNEL
jgi:hypothetical protein